MSGSRHITLINVFFAPNSFGGATVVAEEVAGALIRDHGMRVTAISAMHRTDLADYTVMRAQAGGIVSYLINLPRGRSYVEVYDNPRVTDAILRLTSRLEPDLVHAHCIQDLGAGLMPALKAAGLPVILSTHDFWWLCERQFMIRPDRRYCGQDPIDIEACAGCVEDIARARIRHAALREAAAAADVITFPSRFAMDLCQRSGLAAPRLEVWENGIRGPGPGFFEAQAARRAADPRLVFGYVGGPSQVKGWPLVKAAFEGLGRDDFKGYLVEGSLDERWWRGQVPSLMQGNWRIHPRYDQNTMDSFWARIDVLLFPSQWKETFGLTVREAVARGIHVLQTDCGGAAEWDGADRTAMLRIGDGPERLRAAAVRLLDTRPAPPDPVPMRSFADQARAFAGLAGALL
ncbi:MAG: glycosyltransferase [Rhodobacter sp.]|nr:glycosyltransferase [Rhodobacter sp.]